MPTYEYECKSCSHSFEAFQAMSEDPLSSCPSCGGAVRRLIGGGTGIIFKGSGFYKNDSRKSTSGSVNSSSKASSGESGASTDGAAKSEAPKPEAGKTDSAKSEAPSAPAKTAEAV